MRETDEINEKFLEEYDSRDAVRKYSTGTAGFGINYLLRHDYARVYLNAVDSYLRTSPARPIRVLEFGCGGGMNIIALVALLIKKGIPIERAYGTDFSSRDCGAGRQSLSTTRSGGETELPYCPQRAVG